MKELKRIIFFKQDETIQLVDRNDLVIREFSDHGDDKIVCDHNALRVVTDVLARLGCTMDAKTNIDNPERYWALYRREKIPQTSEHEMLVAVSVSLAGIKVLLEQGKAEEVKGLVASAYEQVRDYLSGKADAEG